MRDSHSSTTATEGTAADDSHSVAGDLVSSADLPDSAARGGRLHDAGWVLARIWKFGEFSGLDAGTPTAHVEESSDLKVQRSVWQMPQDRQRLEKRARKLVGKVIVIQRLGGANGSEPDFVQIKRLMKIGRLENGGLGFWVEGDNKLASTDSRHWGYLKGSEIRGRVLFSHGVM